MIERTKKLIGKEVAFRSAGHNKPRIGTVIGVLVKGDENYPTDAQRNVGTYLQIRDSAGSINVKSRSRCKPIKESK